MTSSLDHINSHQIQLKLQHFTRKYTKIFSCWKLQNLMIIIIYVIYIRVITRPKCQHRPFHFNLKSNKKKLTTITYHYFILQQNFTHIKLKSAKIRYKKLEIFNSIKKCILICKSLLKLHNREFIFFVGSKNTSKKIYFIFINSNIFIFVI